MKNQTIHSRDIKVEISPLSGEIMSIKDNDGTEYLWQADPPYWDRRAINLFPYIGRLTEESYYYKNKRYNMCIHGFLWESVMDVESVSENSVCYFLCDDEATRKIYPFPFEVRIKYELNGKKINVEFEVINTGDECMFFGIGGHPGFRLPLESGLVFEDYYLEFGEKCDPVLIGMTDLCFLNGDDSVFPLQDGKILPLRHDLFDNDAIILKDMCRKVTLKSNKGKKGVTVSFPDMPYLGFWHNPKTEAPFVCIEPWTSLPSRDGVIEDIATQPCLIGLEPDAHYVNTWSIVIHP